MKTIILLIYLLIASPLLGAEPERIAILLRERTQKALSEPLRTYVADVEAHFPVKLQVIARDWKTPKEVRETIKSLHREKVITGVILVGAMPMHLFFMHEHPNPNPLYYEDFDLEFVDHNKDGVDDAYKGNAELTIWVANIRATEKAREDDLPGLRRFLPRRTITTRARLSRNFAYSSSAPRSAPRIGLGPVTGSKGVGAPGFRRRRM
jgi:hypothetical protein